jgi:uncharacterized protein (TIGR00725 family)
MGDTSVAPVLADRCPPPDRSSQPGGYTVTLFGSGEENPEELSLAEEVGRDIGRHGWVLRNGGYGGTMAAAARGARAVGGRVVGVTCGAFGRSGPNAYLSEALETQDLFGRLAGLIQGADAFGAFIGGTGTLTEVFLTWELMAKRLLDPRPLCLIGPRWDGWWELWSQEPALAGRLSLLTRARDSREAIAGLAPRQPDHAPATGGPSAIVG